MTPTGHQDWFTSAMRAEEIKQRSVSGVVATALRRVATQLIQLVALVLLARLLTPSETGLVAMVTAVTGFAGLLAEMALTNLTFRLPNLNHAQCSNLFWLRLLFHALAAVTLLLSAPLLSDFYGDPRAAGALTVLAAGLLVTALGTQHAALLRRNLRFIVMARVAIASAAATSVVSVAAAFQGFGYWALIAGALAGNLASLLLLWHGCSWRPSAPRRGAGMTSLLSQGAQLSTFGVLAYAAGNMSQVVIGRSWGAAEAGLYVRGANLQQQMLSVLWAPLDAITGPAMARLRAEPERMARYYYRVSTLLVTAALPIVFLGLALPLELTRTLLGPQWDTSAEVLRWLSVGALPTVISHTASWVFFSVSDTAAVMRWGFIGWPAMILAVLVGSAFGPVAIAVSLSATTTLLMVPCMLTAFKGTPIRLGALLRALGPAAAACILAAAPTLAVLSQLPAGSEALRLAVAIPVFGAIYAGLLLTVFGQRPLFQEIVLELLRRRAPSHG